MGQNNLKGQQAIKFYRDLKKTKTMADEKGEELKRQIKLRARIDSAEDGSSYEMTVSTNTLIILNHIEFNIEYCDK